MRKDKVKWLYIESPRRLHCTWHCPYTYEEEYDSYLNEEDSWNFPFIRRKNGYKKLQQFNVTCKEFGVKGYSSKKVEELNPYNDDRAMAWNERKSWKRNSKRKHQWVEK